MDAYNLSTIENNFPGLHSLKKFFFTHKILFQELLCNKMDNVLNSSLTVNVEKLHRTISCKKFKLESRLLQQGLLTMALDWSLMKNLFFLGHSFLTYKMKKLPFRSEKRQGSISNASEEIIQSTHAFYIILPPLKIPQFQRLKTTKVYFSIMTHVYSRTQAEEVV